jgi:hypothetical protein
MRAVSLRHRLPPNLFVRLWRRWMAAQANQLLEAARLGSDKVEYLTHGREMSNDDLCSVAGTHVNDLLRRRMLVLELDPYELALSDPALLRHLQGRCAQCESREDCASDLAHASADRAWQGRDDDWRNYCENASVFDMLVALLSRSKAAPKYQFPYLP